MSKSFRLSVSLLLLLATLAFLAACTPKAGMELAGTTPAPNTQPAQPTKPAVPLSPCPKFRDAPNPDQMETNYVLYRDFIKLNQFDKAIPLWRQVYAVSPAADGQRNSVYSDGIRIYEHLIAQPGVTPARRTAYIDTIFNIYDQLTECYPAEAGFADGRKAFDLYYKYPERAPDRLKIFNLFAAAVDKNDGVAPYFIVNPFSALLVELYDTSAITQPQAEKYAKALLETVKEESATAEGPVEKEQWATIAAYAPQRLSYFETVPDFYACSYYIENYYPDFQAEPKDCDVIRTVYSRLKWGGCGETSPELTAVAAAGNDNCRTEGTGSGPVAVAYDHLRNGRYSAAIESFKNLADSTDTAEKKGTYLLMVSKIYYSHLKNFSRARDYARQAASARSGWGEPYLLIGRLYASSGPLCGPGRGFDSQVVVWPAIDMWNRAKAVDGSAAAEANKMIGRYAQYMPDREAIFQRGLKEGDTYRVGCWIGESTVIRTP